MRLLMFLTVALALSSQALAQANPRPGMSTKGLNPDANMPRPIPAVDSLWIEKLTWLEVRDALDGGKITVIIPTGGVEKNGPYVVSGKHNLIIHETQRQLLKS